MFGIGPDKNLSIVLSQACFLQTGIGVNQKFYTYIRRLLAGVFTGNE